MDDCTEPQLIRVDAHDDGLNRWELTRLRAGPGARGDIASYSDYWEVTPGFTTRREMPGIEPVFIVNLGRPVEIVAGNGRKVTVGTGEGFAGATHTRSAVSRSAGSQRGVHVHMKLSTMKRLFRVPLHELVDEAIPLGDAGTWASLLTEELASAATAGCRAAILDRRLRDRLAAAPEENRAVAYAVYVLARRLDVPIEELAGDLGWSRKRLSSQIREATGVGSRLFRRLARFSRLITRLQRREAIPWAELALDCGWFDQPHMLHDFRDFAGVTPREFLARSMPNIGGLVEQ
jgi:AraC-like DNA-binding protein